MPVCVLPCATAFVEKLNDALSSSGKKQQLSAAQKYFLIFVLSATLLTGKLYWATFERRSLGKYTLPALSWMFCKSHIAWRLLLRFSVIVMVDCYGLTTGNLIIDDTERSRSKNTKKIGKVHKIREKKTGGYAKGQELVFLVLQIPLLTIPIDFRFYMPDPDLSQWRQLNARLKKQGVPVRQRLRRPKPNDDFPTKQTLALEMLRDFRVNFPEVVITGILADVLYGNAAFMDGALSFFKSTQVVSQLLRNQKVIYRGKEITVKDCFERYLGSGIERALSVRGGSEQKVTLLSARLMVKAHRKKRFIVALKYEGESDYRYLVATELSWRHQDIARLYSLRWLIEVFLRTGSFTKAGVTGPYSKAIKDRCMA